MQPMTAPLVSRGIIVSRDEYDLLVSVQKELLAAHSNNHDPIDCARLADELNPLLFQWQNAGERS